MAEFLIFSFEKSNLNSRFYFQRSRFSLELFSLFVFVTAGPANDKVAKGSLIVFCLAGLSKGDFVCSRFAPPFSQDTTKKNK